ncbi:M20/M25/M40 family metallo-hydrolase [bacterium]|nr:M20/M25/M40 family metallo-hydrolase [bacterium]
MKELIRKLCEVYGPVGREGAVREVIRQEIEGVVDEVRVDAMGNLIATKRPTQDGAQPGKRIMLAAHMDEIGVMVSHVDEKGFLRVTPVGGVLAAAVLGTQAMFEDGTRGLFGIEGQILVRDKPELSKVFLDVGATSKEDQSLGIGDQAVFRTAFVDQGKRLLAPNFDDRIGCAVLVQVLREIKQTPNEIIAVFTVQEEVGVRGAKVSGFSVEPDLVIALDVTAAGDIPEVKVSPSALGAGPAIKVKDTFMLADLGVRRWLVRTAEAFDIPYQLEILELGGTDASAVQTSRAGVRAGAVSIPSRYVHQPSQMIDYDDVQNCVRLLVNALSEAVAV